MQAPRDKALPYAVAIVVSAIAFALLIGLFQALVFSIAGM
jgi:hypothetical protein